MSSLCTALALVVLAQASEPSQKATPDANAADFRAEVRSALLNARGAQPSQSAIRALVSTYQRLNDDRALPSAQRDRLASAVRTRLRALHAQLVRSAKKNDAIGEMGVHAQRVPQLAGPVVAVQAAAASEQAGGANRLAALIEDIVAPESWEKQGGPGRIRAIGIPVAAQRQAFSQAAGPQRPLPLFGPMPMQAQADDAGEDLAKLIEDVIAPDSWESRGGPGVIRYWGPGKSLVVRQTQDAHEGVVNLIEQLRR